MRDYWKNYKQILLAMMLIFSTFISGNPEFEKSYGESITNTLKFGMTKHEHFYLLKFNKFY